MLAELCLALLLAFTCLYWWVRDREKETQRRYDNCLHPPEKQITIRVNSVLHPGMINTVIPGKRWLKKHCEACGWQRSMYAPTLKPWNEYLDEFDQETIDREAEFNARLREHQLEQKHQEYLRQQKREKGMKQHGRAS